MGRLLAELLFFVLLSLLFHILYGFLRSHLHIVLRSHHDLLRRLVKLLHAELLHAVLFDRFLRRAKDLLFLVGVLLALHVLRVVLRHLLLQHVLLHGLQ